MGNEVLKSWGNVGRRVDRPIARIAVLNEYCITDDRHVGRNRRDTPTVEITTAHDLKESITKCSNEYTIKLIIYVCTIYLFIHKATYFDLPVGHLQVQLVYINKKQNLVSLPDFMYFINVNMLDPNVYTASKT